MTTAPRRVEHPAEDGRAGDPDPRRRRPGEPGADAEQGPPRGGHRADEGAGLLGEPTISSSRSGMKDSKVIMPTDQKTSASDDAHEHPVAAEQQQAALDHGRGLPGLAERVREAGALRADVRPVLAHHDGRDDEVHDAEGRRHPHGGVERRRVLVAEHGGGGVPPDEQAGEHRPDGDRHAEDGARPARAAGRRRRRASSRGRCRRTTPRAARSPAPGRRPSARPRRRRPRSSARARRRSRRRR